MLRILSDPRSPEFDRITRRNVLRIGFAGGLGLIGNARATAGSEPGPYLKDRAVVFLFLGGGPSQLETFDPKPRGVDTSTSVTGHLATAIPGVRFAGSFPKLAARADRLTIVRSFQTHHAEHNGAHKQILTADLTVQDGKPIKQPGLGTVYARAAGATHPGTGMLRNAVIPPTTRHTAEKAGFAGAFESVLEGSQPATLGPAYAPLEIRVPMGESDPEVVAKRRESGQRKGETPNPLIDDLEPRLPDVRLGSRVDLLRQLDRIDRSIDEGGRLDDHDHRTRRAIELLRGGSVRNALDLTREDPRVVADYDTEHFRNYRVGDDSRFLRNGPSIGISLGRQLLLARRLCEAGCGFVTVVHANWDFHARKGIPNTPEGTSVLAPPVDHAVAAFLDDLEVRGLSDRILLVITGEFGRTPKLDDNLGRHHWPRICPLVFGGGGFEHGRVVGQSDRRGGEPATEPITIDDLHATLMHAQFDVGRLRLDPSMPAEVMNRATRGTPIPGFA